MNPFLEFRNVEKRYGPITALDGIDFCIASESTVALLGPNGTGKTTLLGCLLGLVRPSEGEIHLRGAKIGDRDRLRFGYLPERLALYQHRSVWDNGWFFAQLKRQPAVELEHQLKRVGLYAVQDRKVRQLSKGMHQRLGLAIALCGQPELLVLDEPFNGIDPARLDELQNILRVERDRGATLLIATHTISAIEPLATHVAILLDGHLAASGPIDELRAAHAEDSLETIYHRVARAQAQEGAMLPAPTKPGPTWKSALPSSRG
ncbi:MAG: ABC transporter ATP-binding protein [Verrucomicrobia bacterium]|nr:ABC transporter ATP-binding protein [Verrucomicrobiota bacterium]